MIKRAAIGLLALAAALALVLVVNTWRQGSRQVAVAALAPMAVDKAAVAESMAAAVRARTVSGLLDPTGVAAEFERLHEHLRTRYPLAHATLQREVVGAHSLLYTWTGSDAKARPLALPAHQDVVPIAPGTERLWKKPPFAGVIEDGFVWGRGTLDNKSNLVTQLEAVEALLRAGFKPRRTVHLIFGDDEEVGGERGAKAVAELLRQRGVRLDFVVDEGMVVTEGVLPGVKQPLALIGLGEKNLKLTAQGGARAFVDAAGRRRRAIGMLSAALTLDQHPMTGGIHGAAASFVRGGRARSCRSDSAWRCPTVAAAPAGGRDAGQGAVVERDDAHHFALTCSTPATRRTCCPGERRR
ncbi:MAG: M20/M25/M40 family metallo-hydrolase [Rubrivivax sp.]